MSTKKKKCGINKLPFDCWCHITTFIGETQDFISLCLSIKGYNEYVKKMHSFCVRNVKFTPNFLPSDEVSRNFVRNIALYLYFDMDDDLFSDIIKGSSDLQRGNYYSLLDVSLEKCFNVFPYLEHMDISILSTTKVYSSYPSSIFSFASKSYPLIKNLSFQPFGRRSDVKKCSIEIQMKNLPSLESLDVYSNLRPKSSGGMRQICFVNKSSTSSEDLIPKLKIFECRYVDCMFSNYSLSHFKENMKILILECCCYFEFTNIEEFQCLEILELKNVSFKKLIIAKLPSLKKFTFLQINPLRLVGDRNTGDSVLSIDFPSISSRLEFLQLRGIVYTDSLKIPLGMEKLESMSLYFFPKLEFGGGWKDLDFSEFIGRCCEVSVSPNLKSLYVSDHPAFKSPYAIWFDESVVLSKSRQQQYQLKKLSIWANEIITIDLSFLVNCLEHLKLSCLYYQHYHVLRTPDFEEITTISGFEKLRKVELKGYHYPIKITNNPALREIVIDDERVGGQTHFHHTPRPEKAVVRISSLPSLNILRVSNLWSAGKIILEDDLEHLHSLVLENCRYIPTNIDRSKLIVLSIHRCDSELNISSFTKNSESSKNTLDGDEYTSLERLFISPTISPAKNWGLPLVDSCVRKLRNLRKLQKMFFMPYGVSECGTWCGIEYLSGIESVEGAFEHKKDMIIKFIFSYKKIFFDSHQIEEKWIKFGEFCKALKCLSMKRENNF